MARNSSDWTVWAKITPTAPLSSGFYHSVHGTDPNSYLLHGITPARAVSRSTPRYMVFVRCIFTMFICCVVQPKDAVPKRSAGICWRTRYNFKNIWHSTGFWQTTESKPPRNCNPPRICSPCSLIPLCGSENHSTKKEGTPMKNGKRCCRWKSARAPPRSSRSAENCGSARRSKRTQNGCRPVFTKLH